MRHGRMGGVTVGMEDARERSLASAPGARGTVRGVALLNIPLFAAYAAALSVLLPSEVARVDPEGKVGSFAVVAGVSASVTIVAQPLLGALSDRGRSRTPWLVGYALLGGLAYGLLGAAGSIVGLVVLWSLAQFLLNGVDVTSSALLIDRVDRGRRGFAFALTGVAAVVGGAAGVAVVGRVPPVPAFVGIAVLVVLACAVFAARVPGAADRVARAAAPGHAAPLVLRRLLIDPREHPRFVVLIGWRFLFLLSHGCVSGMLLYLATDHLGATEASAAGAVAGATAAGGAALIVTALLGGRIGDRTGRPAPFLLAAGALVIAGDLVLLAVPSLGGLLAAGAAFGAGLGLALACGTALGAELLPDPRGGAAYGLGLLNVASNLAQVAAPVLAAALITSAGGFPALLVSSAATALLSSAVAASLLRPSRAR